MVFPICPSADEDDGARQKDFMLYGSVVFASKSLICNMLNILKNSPVIVWNFLQNLKITAQSTESKW